MKTIKITKTTEFGNLIKKITELGGKGRLNSIKDLELVTLRHDYLIVKCSEYAFSHIRIIFGKPYYNIEMVNEDIQV